MDILGMTIAIVALVGWLGLTFLRGWFWRPVVDSPLPDLMRWPSVLIVVPARNEAEMLPRCLDSLLEQNYPGEWHITLVDDHSTDRTAEIARERALVKGLSARLTVVAAPDLEQGWSGKVAAMQAGLTQRDSDYILFTDADIEHPPNSLRQLMARSVTERLDLNSLMVRLNCDSFAEQLLIPAFSFFFAMLYPFRKANEPASAVAAAAGGVMLVKRQALANAGGLATIKDALIDDCALARAIKDHGGDYSAGGRLRLALSEDVVSLRPYPMIADVKAMIARTAFTQLRHSNLLLAATVAGIALLFLAPPLLLIVGSDQAAAVALATWLWMTIIYMPMVRFYRLSFVWAFTLPVAAAIYLAATLESARQYRQGLGGQWKGRTQAS